MIILCHWLTLSTGRVQPSDRYLKPVIPDFVDVNVDALKHAQVLGDLQQPVLPDNFDELSADKKQVGNQSNHRLIYGCDQYFMLCCGSNR